MQNKTKPGYVYKVICDIPEPHIVYIGSTTQTPRERLGHHSTIQRRPTKLNKLIQQHGKEHFSIDIIEWISDKSLRIARERYWTEQYKNEPDNCNERLGNSYSVELRERASRDSYRNRAVVCDNDDRHYVSCTSAAKVYNVNTSDVSECCAMHLKQVKGLRFRYEDLDKSLYDTYWNNGGVVRNRHILCVETGEVFHNAVEAAHRLGVAHTAIMRCCRRGGMLRKSKLHLVFEGAYAHSLNPATRGSDSP